jgi:hypothetical protein
MSAATKPPVGPISRRALPRNAAIVGRRVSLLTGFEYFAEASLPSVGKRT